MSKLWLALALAVWSSSAAASDMALEDMVGRWCETNPDTHTYVFTQSDLTVIFPNNGTRVLQIEEVIPHGNRLEIRWSGLPAGLDNTYYEISADKRILYQAQNDKGDHGPRRALKRC